MSDELTSAMNAYLSHYPDATDDLKKGIADALIDNIKRSIPNQSFGTFSSGPDDKKSDDKIRFVQEYLKSIGMTPTRVESYANSGTRMVHFERANQSPQDLVGSTQSSGTFADHVSKTVDRIASEKVRLYGIGSNPKLLTSDLNALQKIADRLGGDNDISFTDVGLEHAKFIPQVTVPDQNGRSHPDPDRPARWELSLEQAVKAGIVEGLKFQSLSERSAPVPVMHPHPAYGSGRLSTSARARQATAQTPWEQSGNVDRSAVFTGRAEGDIPDLNNPPRWDSGIPPAPPGGNDPPGPPDEPEDDDGILRQLLEFFQRMFGVRPDIANRDFLDTLANNLTSILGGVPAQAGADGQRPSSVATLMDTFADYFNVPRETEEATREAQDNLRRSIDRLTEATNGAANGGTPSQPQTRWQRFRGFFRRGRTRRGGIATATRIATYMRPVLTRIGNILPRGVRNTAAQFGQNVVGRMAQRYGIPAATAARFGAALGPAAVGLGAVLYALPLIGAAATSAVKGLMYLSSESMKTTMRLVNYSGLLSHANANLEVNRVLRDFRAAQAIQGRGAARIRLKDQIENEWAPISIAITKIGNEFGQLFDNVTLFGLKSAKAIAGIQNEQESQFFESMRNIMAFSRVLLGMGVMPDLNGNQDDQDLRRFAGREAIFGQNAVDMVDFNRRQRGPRRPVNPNGGGN